jgi:hypothetical protein
MEAVSYFHDVKTKHYINCNAIKIKSVKCVSETYNVFSVFSGVSLTKASFKATEIIIF